jgi:hypothetical protein
MLAQEFQRAVAERCGGRPLAARYDCTMNAIGTAAAYLFSLQSRALLAAYMQPERAASFRAYAAELDRASRAWSALAAWMSGARAVLLDPDPRVAARVQPHIERALVHTIEAVANALAYAEAPPAGFSGPSNQAAQREEVWGFWDNLCVLATGAIEAARGIFGKKVQCPTIKAVQGTVESVGSAIGTTLKVLAWVIGIGGAVFVTAWLVSKTLPQVKKALPPRKRKASHANVPA